MDKKAQTAQIGIAVIMMTFITVLVGVVLFQTIAQEAGSTTTLGSLPNTTISVVNGTTTYLDYRALSGVIINNATAGLPLTVDDDYIVTNNVIDPSDGTLSVGIAVGPKHNIASNSWNISATSAQETTYITSGGGRAVVGLIAIFFALAIAVIALEPTLRSNVLDMMGK